MGPPEELTLLVAEALGAATFVETGTHRGDTAAWAAKHFSRVITVEAAEAIYEQALAAHGELPNVEFVFGDSRATLRGLVPTLDGSAIFWLDSHWSGGLTYGQGDECPLLDELAAIVASPHPHAILIDDARLFESAPPRPHDPAQWPSIDQVVEVLLAARERPGIAIVEDVIAAVPRRATALLVAYAQDVNTRVWESASAPQAPSLLRRVAARVLSRARR